MIFCHYCLSSKHKWAQCPLNTEEYLIQQQSAAYLLRLVDAMDPECAENIFNESSEV